MGEALFCSYCCYCFYICLIGYLLFFFFFFPELCVKLCLQTRGILDAGCSTEAPIETSFSPTNNKSLTRTLANVFGSVPL